MLHFARRHMQFDQRISFSLKDQGSAFVRALLPDPMWGPLCHVHILITARHCKQTFPLIVQFLAPKQKNPIINC